MKEIKGMSEGNEEEGEPTSLTGLGPEFDTYVRELNARAKEIHGLLAGHGIRIFQLTLRSGNTYDRAFFIHPCKTVLEWREEVREFCGEVFEEEPGQFPSGGDDARNGLFRHLESLGYVEISDVVADVFEGRFTNERSRLVDDPNHEDQLDGFGHYGHG
jgi:hypothetical protein